jgi:hypothetical protein
MRVYNVFHGTFLYAAIRSATVSRQNKVAVSKESSYLVCWWQSIFSQQSHYLAI